MNGRRPRSGRHGRALSGSVIDEIARLAAAHDAVDLARGAPDFPAPDALKEAAVAAIRGDLNQYTNTWGRPDLREALSRHLAAHFGLSADPEREVTVTCGATEALLVSALALLAPGDEVVLFEPAYDHYRPTFALAGATTRSVLLHPPAWTFDEAQLRRAFTRRTRAVLVNSPANPSGKVFAPDELRLIAERCIAADAICLADEVYAHLAFDGRQHVSMMGVEGMRERTVVLGSLSKSHTITGWRLGFAVAAPMLTRQIRVVHELATASAPAPLQAAAIAGLALPPSHYREAREAYQHRRDRLARILEPLGFRCYVPHGSLYLMADVRAFGFRSDVDFVEALVRDVGVAAVPGSAFYEVSQDGRQLVRFCFAKATETLDEAERRLRGVLAPAFRGREDASWHS